VLRAALFSNSTKRRTGVSYRLLLTTYRSSLRRTSRNATLQSRKIHFLPAPQRHQPGNHMVIPICQNQGQELRELKTNVLKSVLTKVAISNIFTNITSTQCMLVTREETALITNVSKHITIIICIQS